MSDAAEAVKKNNQKTLTIPIDVTHAKQVQTAVEQAITEFDHIDILINTGDIHFFKPFVEIKNNEWKKVMDYNFYSALYFCQAVGKHMLERKKGRIINVISGLSERGMANGSAYCVSMGSVLQLTRALAMEWALEGITVNAIGTGWFSESGQSIDENLTKYIPAKRYGKPEEIGSLAVYLASDVTEFTTGQVMYVDGGLMAHA
jgi:NAD(P)-dependent dehydrogenase (short-subunit alcohol dehydrogenase family)